MRLGKIDIPGVSLCVTALSSVWVAAALLLASFLAGRTPPRLALLELDVSQVASLLVIVCSALAMGLCQRAVFDRPGLLERAGTGFGVSISATTLIAGLVPGLVSIDLALVAGHAVAFAGLALQRIFTTRVNALDLLARRVLVIGGDRTLASLRALADTMHPPGFRIVGTLSGQRVASDPACVGAMFRLTKAHEIVVSAGFDPACTPGLLECHARGAEITSFGAFVERETRQIELDDPEATRLVVLDSAGRGRPGHAVKRALDLAGSLALLGLVAPIMIATALAIRLTDGAPILYRQERVGQGGRRFSIHKFRTMRVDAEADGRARWAAPGDPRITRVGGFLRKSRIDELPQLFNVLGGDMSLVGPRPERPSIVAELERTIPLYSCRHFVPPGITGWAQVNYPYGASHEDAVRKTRYDLYYVKNACMLLDFLTLLKTVRVVLMGGVEPAEIKDAPAPSLLHLSDPVRSHSRAPHEITD